MGTDVQFRLTSNRGRVNLFSGAFYPAGTGAVTGEANTARATVARTNTGKITVTFPIYYGDFYGAHAQVNMASPDGHYANIDSFNKNSSGQAVMVIGTYASNNSAADLSADANTFVHWQVTVRK